MAGLIAVRGGAAADGIRTVAGGCMLCPAGSCVVGVGAWTDAGGTGVLAGFRRGGGNLEAPLIENG